MTTLLLINASARREASDNAARGSHTRHLTRRFVTRWLAARPADAIVVRDVGQSPPTPVTGRWVDAAFTKPERRAPWMIEALAESDALIDELIAADLILAGVPMYNFGVPAQFKAYIDNVVRIGRTFGFDRSREDDPYSALLAGQGKRLVIVSARGDYGYDRGARLAHLNHVEPSLQAVFGFIGINDIRTIAVEYDEFGDERLRASVARAESEIDALADCLLASATEHEANAARQRAA